MKRKFEKWLGLAGAVRSKYQDEFDVLEAKVQTVFEELEGRVSYKDLYMITTMLSAGVVGNLVRSEANRRELVKERRQPRRVQARVGTLRRPETR